MRLGLTTPIVTLYPPGASEWEHTATVDDLMRIATAADELGYHHLTCSEHIAVPREIAKVRGGRYWDPLATLSFLAARTTDVKLLTSVVVLGYHHPLEIAKRYGTLDLLSRGRLVLGVGVGSLREEFELLGAEFENRGALADESLREIRASLSNPTPGRYPGFVVDPVAVQERVPVWVGGQSRRSLRRALELGDGWMPFGHSPAEFGRWLSEADVPEGFAVALRAAGLDPIGDPDGSLETLAELESARATYATVTFTARDAVHFTEQMDALMSLQGNRSQPGSRRRED